MPERTRNATIVRVIAYVLCTFLIGASLDAIPDPPAVTQHAQHSLASQVDQNAATPCTIGNRATALWFPLLGSDLSNAQFLEAPLPCIGLVLVSQATDTSPPRFS